MNYEIQFSPLAKREIKKLPPQILERVGLVLDELAHDPRPPGVKKLQGLDDTYRVRVGDYRIVYEIQDNLLIVLVLSVAHRREVYRDLI
jgi:mRNA interferase RelE/StbE